MGGGAGGGSGFGGSGDLAAGVTPTGRTTTVRVEAGGMRVVPASLTVPAGDRLVIDLVNVDPGQTHDLVFASGARTARLHTGDSATLDLGVVGSSTQGWCSVVGHRLMGMVFDVVVTGATTDSAHSGSHGAATPTGGAAGLGGDDTAYPIPPAVGAVRLRLLTARHVADLRGATLCRTATPEEVDAVIPLLGLPVYFRTDDVHWLGRALGPPEGRADAPAAGANS